MAVTTLQFPVSNVAAVLTAYDQIKVWRSTTGISGTYTEISASGTRPILAVGQTIYSFTDAASDATYYYTFNFFNSSTLTESPKSAPVLGVVDPYTAILTPEELKSIHLFGIPLTDAAGNPIPDATFRHYIRSAVDYVERKLDVTLHTTVIVDERLTFNFDDARQLWFVKTKKRPIQSVDQMSVWMPADEKNFTFPDSWVRILGRQTGMIQVLPGKGNLEYSPSNYAPGPAFPWLGMDVWGWGRREIPDAISVSYVAGYTTAELPPIVKDLIAALASMPLLATAGDLLFGPGMMGSAVSLDALMTNTRTTKDARGGAFSGRVKYLKDYSDQLMLELRTILGGVRLVIPSGPV